MTSLRKFKKQADSVLTEVFRSLFEEIDTEKLKKEISVLKRTSPDFDPADHARLLTRRTALRCAATGAITGMPSGLMAVATLGADLAYLVYQQFRMILGIATIYGHEPSSKERFTEALSCLALGSGISLGRQGITVALESAAALEGGIVAQKIGSKILYERLGKVVPVIGALSAGAISYFAVRAVGRATIRYYESLIDPALADEIWLEGDREHA